MVLRRFDAVVVLRFLDLVVRRFLVVDLRLDLRALLREHNMAFSEVDLLIVELCEGQSLSSMCLYLLGAELSIRFAYPLMLRPGGDSTPTIALAVDDHVLAGVILRTKSFRLLGEAELP